MITSYKWFWSLFESYKGTTVLYIFKNIIERKIFKAFSFDTSIESIFRSLIWINKEDVETSYQLLEILKSKRGLEKELEVLHKNYQLETDEKDSIQRIVRSWELNK